MAYALHRVFWLVQALAAGAPYISRDALRIRLRDERGNSRGRGTQRDLGDKSADHRRAMNTLPIYAGFENLDPLEGNSNNDRNRVSPDELGSMAQFVQDRYAHLRFQAPYARQRKVKCK